MTINQINKAYSDSLLFFEKRYKKLLSPRDYRKFRSNYSKGLKTKLNKLKVNLTNKEYLVLIYKYDQRFYAALDKQLNTKVKLRKYKYFNPYLKNGKARFYDIHKKSGVYIIREQKPGETPKIVYIGFSGSDIYKTMYRHFQSWEDSQQVRITYQDRIDVNNYTVRVVLCSPSRAAKLEKALIMKNPPRDNDQKYEMYKQDKETQFLFKEYQTTDTLNVEPF